MRSRRWTPGGAAVFAALGVDGGSGGEGAQEFPPDGQGAEARLASSPRHGEWVRYDAGDGDRVSAWVVYPERSDPAPVIVVIHEIYGLSDWIRAVADQLAAQGYLAIAPALPSATDRVGVVGFCWGGTSSFAVATAWDDLDAAVVYYGTCPDAEELANVWAPVQGHYGGHDNRVNATIPDARAEMERLGKRYEPNIYEGAGHGFLRQQDGRGGANLEATRAAWPRTIAFFQEHLDR